MWGQGYTRDHPTPARAAQVDSRAHSFIVISRQPRVVGVGLVAIGQLEMMATDPLITTTMTGGQRPGGCQEGGLSILPAWINKKRTGM